MKLFTALLSLTLASTVLAAEDEHKHDHEVSFATAAAGLSALDEYIVEIKEKSAAGDFEALHPVSEELRGAGEGLTARLVEIAADNKERFKFNAEQVRALGDQLLVAHEVKDAAAIERIVKRLEGVRDRMKALAPK